jgi:hypothetical protein
MSDWTLWVDNRPSYSDRNRPIEIKCGIDGATELTTAAAIPAWWNVADLYWRFADDTADPSLHHACGHPGVIR